MAKEMDFVNNQDVEFPNSYWKIVSICDYIKEKRFNVVLYGYKDKSARTNNKEPIRIVEYYFKDDVYKKIKTKLIDKTYNAEEIFYSLISDNDDFKNSTDVLEKGQILDAIKLDEDDQNNKADVVTNEP